MPLNIGRLPFFVSVADNPAGSTGARTLVPCIDLESPGVQESGGESLFDANGSETPYLRHKLGSVAELVDGEQWTRLFVERLVALKLIQPIQIEIKSPNRQPRKISGLHSIDEKKLRILDGLGYLHAMHAMLSSLGHLQILARRAPAPSAAS